MSRIFAILSRRNNDCPYEKAPSTYSDHLYAHHFNLVWGHGGQLIVVVDSLDLVIVTTADPLYGQTGDGPWNHEKAIINLVADFIASLPGG